MTATSPVDIAVLEAFEQPTSSQFAQGALSNATQTQVTWITTGATAEIYSAESLARLGARDIVPGPVQSAGANFIWGSDAADRLVIEAFRVEGVRLTQTIFSIDPVAFRTDAECRITASVNDVTFFGDRAFYITPYASSAQLTEFNLTTGTCNRFNDAAGGVDAYAMYYEGRGRLHVYSPSTVTGQAVVDIDPASPTYGAYLDAPTGLGAVSIFGGWVWWGRQTNDVYIASRALTRSKRLSSSPAVTLVPSLPGAPPLVSLDQRWVAIGLNGTTDIVFDNARGIIAREGKRFGDTGRGVALAGPQGTRFVVYRANNGPATLTRYDIRD